MSRLQHLLSSLPPLEIPQPPPFSLVEFTLFPKLPPELRDKIWTYAAEEPRTIILQQVLDGSNPREHFLSDETFWSSAVTGQTRHPGIMQVCRESRQRGAKFYEKCYEVAQGCCKGVEGNAIFINFSIDGFELHLRNPYNYIRPSPNDPSGDRGPHYQRESAIRTMRFSYDHYNLGPDILERAERINWVQHPGSRSNRFPKFLLKFAPVKEFVFEMEPKPISFFCSYILRDKYQRDAGARLLASFARSANNWKSYFLPFAKGGSIYTLNDPTEKLAFSFRWKWRDGEDLDTYLAFWDSYQP
jgi:hypothetical protein